MADNISIKDGAAATVVIAAKDVSSVYVPASTPVTPANVTMVGTAGSAAAGVMTVQGIASGTVIPISLAAAAASIAKAEDVASAGADVGVPAMIVQTAAPANTAADGDYAFLQADTGYLWVATPKLVKTSVNFTCPNNTSHVINDTIADNSTAGSVTKLAWTPTRANGVIRRVRIRKSDQTVATPTLRLWLWDATFTVGAGDDAAFANPLADTLGFVDVAVTSAGSDDAVGWGNCDIPFTTGTLFGLLQTLTTFTVAASEVFTVDIWYEPR